MGQQFRQLTKLQLQLYCTLRGKLGNEAQALCCGVYTSRKAWQWRGAVLRGVHLAAILTGRHYCSMNAACEGGVCVRAVETAAASVDG